MALVCKHCGQLRGRHQASSLNCPIGGGLSFDRSKKFVLNIDHVENMETDLEREVAHRVLKNVEAVFDCFQLGHQRMYSQAEIVDVLTMLKKGYGL
jgi:hypothetical protein